MHWIPNIPGHVRDNVSRFTDEPRLITALEDHRSLMGNICDIEVVRQGNAFVAKVRFEEERSIKEFKSPNFEGILEQLQVNLQDKFEDLFHWE